MYLKLFMFTLRHVPLAICFTFIYLTISHYWKRRQYPQELKKCLPSLIYYYIKYVISYVVIGFKHLYVRENRLQYNSETLWKGIINDKNELNLEQRHDQENDTIVFQGTDDEGNQIFIRVSAFREKSAERWIVLRLVGERTGEPLILVHPEYPNTIQHNSKPAYWDCGGLVVEMHEPFQRWKVSYNGWLRKVNPSRDNENDLVHVRFSFYWSALSKYFNFDCDLNTALMADFLAQQPWSFDIFQNLIKSPQQRYEQWGQFSGSILVEEYQEIELKLRGMRYHAFGTSKRCLSCGICGYTTHGLFFHIGAVAVSDGQKPFIYGYARDMNLSLELSNIAFSSFDLSHLNGNLELPKEFTIGFSTKQEKYVLRLQYQNSVDLMSVTCDASAKMQFMNLTLNGDCGHGVLLTEKPITIQKQSIIRQTLPISATSLDSLSDHEKSLLVVPLCSRAAECEALVGGKATQLSHLCRFEGQFTVPAGISVTTKAFELVLKDIPAVAEALKRLNHPNPQDLHFDSVKVLFESIDVPSKIKESISNELFRQFGDSWNERKFAVRSSAVGEDGSEASSAGQMDTILGVAGPDNIYSALLKCWSSAFTQQAHQYRKQHGQSLLTQCGIVIQEMVPAEVSGVLFTWDPVKGHPGRLIINASYGIGEAIVSGITEPDTITVLRNFDDTQLTVDQKHLGSKAVRILEDGSSDTSFNGNSSIDCCLSDAQIINLAEVGIRLEEYFGSPRDVEWALNSNDQLYLLQSRPITGLMRETDAQIMQEFDSPIDSSDQYTTTHNVGEVLGGVNSTLGISTVVTLTDRALQVNVPSISGNLHWERTIAIKYFANQVLLDLSNTVYSNADAHVFHKAYELCVLGQPVEDEHLEQLLKKQYDKCPRWKRLMNTVWNVKNFSSVASVKAIMMKEHSNYKFAEYYSENDPKQLLIGIERMFNDYFRTMRCHSNTSGLSAAWYATMMGILTKHEKEWGNDIHSQVALLYTSCENVESADVPTALQELAAEILSVTEVKHFLEMSSTEILHWLHSSESGSAGAAFDQFLQKHGHRCMHEIDLYEKSWSESPIDLIPVLQNVAKSLASDPDRSHQIQKREIPSDEAIDMLKIPLTSIEKYIMRWIVPWARAAVGGREQTKSLVIKVGHAIRVAYRKLSKILCEQGTIPDNDLLYYMTHMEVKNLVTESSAIIGPQIVARAQRRRQVRPLQDKVMLGKVIRGYPKDLSVLPPAYDLSGSDGLKGTPVSGGHVEAVVRVCKSLEDAAHIQKGEILVAHSTDIAWSLYFPLLSGVVTELGGLLSHGAVVAREYGLPCLVSVYRATDFFQTGDRCVLDAETGRITKVGHQDQIEQ